MVMDKIVQTNPEILAAAQDDAIRKNVEKERKTLMRHEAHKDRKLRGKRKEAPSYVEIRPTVAKPYPRYPEVLML